VPLALAVWVGGRTTIGGVYQPTAAAPAAWGTVTLSRFQVGNPAQPAGSALCYGGSADLSSCAYVTARLSLDYTVSFLGATMRIPAFVTDTQVLDTYDTQTQTYQ
jgi:hypothetical protein